MNYNVYVLHMRTCINKRCITMLGSKCGNAVYGIIMQLTAFCMLWYTYHKDIYVCSLRNSIYTL